MKLQSAPKFVFEPDPVYYEKAKQYLTAHQLIDFIKCPLLYYQKKMGIITQPETDDSGQLYNIQV